MFQRLFPASRVIPFGKLHKVLQHQARFGNDLASLEVRLSPRAAVAAAAGR
jgi:hypothetical protein